MLSLMMIAVAVAVPNPSSSITGHALCPRSVAHPCADHWVAAARAAVPWPHKYLKCDTHHTHLQRITSYLDISYQKWLRNPPIVLLPSPPPSVILHPHRQILQKPSSLDNKDHHHSRALGIQVPRRRHSHSPWPSYPPETPAYIHSTILQTYTLYHQDKLLSLIAYQKKKLLGSFLPTIPAPPIHDRRPLRSLKSPQDDLRYFTSLEASGTKQ
ncbi:hypothetical protein T439DRAFT_376340 [Meredithblackwellia eburnea MCA 4105]